MDSGSQRSSKSLVSEVVARKHAPSTVDYDSRVLWPPMKCVARRYERRCDLLASHKRQLLCHRPRAMAVCSQLGPFGALCGSSLRSARFKILTITSKRKILNRRE